MLLWSLLGLIFLQFLYISFFTFERMSLLNITFSKDITINLNLNIENYASLNKSLLTALLILAFLVL